MGQNKYFSLTESGDPRPLVLGIEARRGYFMSVCPMYKQLMVNVNICRAAFYMPGNMADAIIEFDRRGGIPPYFIHGLSVETTHLRGPRKYTVCCLEASAQEQTFLYAKSGKVITVEHYFEESKSTSYSFLFYFKQSMVYRRVRYQP